MFCLLRSLSPSYAMATAMDADEEARKRKSLISSENSSEDDEKLRSVKKKKTKGLQCLEALASSSKDGSISSSNSIEHNDVIMIKPKREQNQAFFANNVKIYRLLQDSLFGKAGIIENKRYFKDMKQMVKIKDTKYMNELLKVNKLGEFDVECIPYDQMKADSKLKYKIGVIGSFGLDTDVEELNELIKSDSESPIRKIERIKSYKTKDPTPTTLMKIWIDAEELPEYVVIMAERFKVRPFIQRTIQCYKCQGFNHFASQCKGEQSCLLCAEAHSLDNCPNKDSGAKKCKNCGGNHTSNYSKCPDMIKQNQIQKIKSTKSLSYKDALLKYEEKNKNSTPQMRSDNTNDRYAPNIPNTLEYQDASTNTEQIEVATNTEQITENSATGGMDDKFLAFILEVVSGLSSTQTSLDNKCKLLSKSFKFYFNRDYEYSSIKSAIGGRVSLKGTVKPTVLNG